MFFQYFHCLVTLTVVIGILWSAQTCYGIESIGEFGVKPILTKTVTVNTKENSLPMSDEPYVYKYDNHIPCDKKEKADMSKIPFHEEALNHGDKYLKTEDGGFCSRKLKADPESNGRIPINWKKRYPYVRETNYGELLDIDLATRELAAKQIPPRIRTKPIWMITDLKNPEGGENEIELLDVDQQE